MPPSDAELIALVLMGWADAFEALVRRHLDAAWAVALLGPGTRTTPQTSVLLHDVEGWRHAEIADRIGLAEGTVRYHLHRARKVLQGSLGGRYSEEAVG